MNTLSTVTTLLAGLLTSFVYTSAKAETISSRTQHGCLAAEADSEGRDSRTGAALLNTIVVSGCPDRLYKWNLEESGTDQTMLLSIDTNELGRVCLSLDPQNRRDQNINVAVSTRCRGRLQNWQYADQRFRITYEGQRYCLEVHSDVGYTASDGSAIGNVYAAPCRRAAAQRWSFAEHRSTRERPGSKSAANARCLYDDGRGSGATRFPCRLTLLGGNGSFSMRGEGIANNGITYELTVDESRPDIAYGLARTNDNALQLGIFVRERRDQACWRGRRFGERICAW